MSKTTQNSIVRLKTPASVRRTGRPECMLIEKNGQVYRLKWGQDFRVSAHCDPDNKIASLDGKGGYPLIHKEFVASVEAQFETINEE